ncbi:MAG: hypothetical protein ACR2G6_07845 [Gemmatimonadaceae bacterium]
MAAPIVSSFIKRWLAANALALALLSAVALPARLVSGAQSSASIRERASGSCRAVAPNAAAAYAIRHACTRAATQVARLLGRAVPPGVVSQAAGPQMADADVARLSGERWAMAVPANWAPAKPLELGVNRQISAEGYLAHEIAHRMAFAVLYPSGTPDSTPEGYGSPLPDWLDEAMGLLAEPDTDQSARLSMLFEDEIIYAMPLRRFLYTPHPALRGARAGDANRRIFYGQSLAFGLYLRELAGVSGFQRLVRALRSGTAQGVALTDIRGLPRNGGDLEQAWLAWLRTRRDAMRRVGALQHGSGAQDARHRKRSGGLARSPPAWVAFLVAQNASKLDAARTR